MWTFSLYIYLFIQFVLRLGPRSFSLYNHLNVLLWIVTHCCLQSIFIQQPLFIYIYFFQQDDTKWWEIVGLPICKVILKISFCPSHRSDKAGAFQVHFISQCQFVKPRLRLLHHGACVLQEDWEDLACPPGWIRMLDDPSIGVVWIEFWGTWVIALCSLQFCLFIWVIFYYIVFIFCS